MSNPSEIIPLVGNPIVTGGNNLAAEGLLEFEDIEAMDTFLRNIGWTPTIEMQMLIDIIQNTDSETVRLRALKQLQDRRNQILKSSGLLVKASKTQDDGRGGHTVFSAEVLASAFPDKKKRKKKNVEQPTTIEENPELESTGDVISTQSDASLHKPPTGNDAVGTDKVDPEIGGNLTSEGSERNSRVDGDGEESGECPESILRGGECSSGDESSVRESTGGSPELQHMDDEESNSPDCPSDTDRGLCRETVPDAQNDARQ